MENHREQRTNLNYILISRNMSTCVSFDNSIQNGSLQTSKRRYQITR